LGPKMRLGTMQLDAPHLIDMAYARDLMAPLLLNADPGWPRNALFIGLGVGATQQFLHKYRPDCVITTVEIFQDMIKVAQDHFHLPPLSNNFQIVVQCGAEFMQNCTTQYDLIVLDAHTENPGSSPLESSDFYLNCKSCLSNQGYIVTNLLYPKPEFQAILGRFIKAFDYVSWTLRPWPTGNVILMSHTGAGFTITKAELEQNGRQLNADTGLDLTATVNKLTESIR